MPGRQTLVIELLAPIERVWQALADADGWAVADDARVTVVSGRAPDRVTWHVTGPVRGVVEWELDDLDALTFARSEWQLAPAAGRVASRRAVSQRAHDERSSRTAALLSRAVGADLLLVRSDPKRARHEPERAPRGAGPMLLGAMWLTARPRR